ncbi:DUF302 domain-containing protein [Thiobacillus sp.]|uniref:DUF302 domain-containing protein n=1 Tax=Thiobacillus sp. TaxID=924 RepID=UPI00286E55D6|nr:DUF302 domain-containing protein [Thiobacillus sp.]
MIRFAVSLSVDEAADKLIAAIAAYPMGLVANANGQANCAKKGISVPADQVLEVFRPDYAVKVWAADKAAGIDIPLRIHLYEADGHTWVAYRPASVVFRPYANPQLDGLGGELDVIFNQLLAALDAWRIPS